MVTRFFADPQGNFVGGFDGADPPPGSIEVQTAPPDGRAIWNGGEWIMPIIVPASVSAFQAKAALAEAGHLPTAEAIVAAADALTKLAWAGAREFRRASPLINALAGPGGLGLTQEQLDALFVRAAEIEA